MAQSSVASSATSVTLLASTTSRPRKGVIISNDDANRLYVLCDSAAASTSNYTLSLAQNENCLIPDYNGEIRGIWASAGSGAARITTLHG